MNLTTRDKWMCAILPALLTTIVCQRAFLHPMNVQIEGLLKQIQSQGPLSARVAAFKQAEAEYAQLRNAVEARRKQRADEISRAPFNRTLALQQISKLCEAHDLTLFSSGPDTASKLPPSIGQAASVLVKAGDSSPPQIWRLELGGSYVSMVEFLDALATESTLVVPFEIGMQPDADENLPTRWNLSVWL